MATKVSCQQVGFENCDFETQGTTPEVTSDLITHVRQMHGVQLPENVLAQPELELPEPERMVWARIQNAINEPRRTI